MPELTLLHYGLLLAAGLVAGTVDAIAGGGGLITLPVLLGLGLPVPFALGTNKLGAAFGTGSASWSYSRRGAVNLRECVPGIVATAAGALGGSAQVGRIDSAFLSHFIPWLLALIVVFMIFRPTLGHVASRQRMQPRLFFPVFGITLGFYDGFFGPGVGSFWTIAFVGLLGLDFLQASARARVMNFTSNLTALIVFATTGTVLLVPGLVLGAGQLMGGRLGAHLALARGARFVRPIFLVTAGLTVLKLLYQHHFRP